MLEGRCVFDRREDQLLKDRQQQSSLCESWCRQRGDRGHVNSFISLILTKSLVVPPTTKKLLPLPLPKSIIPPPATPPFYPPPPSFSTLKNERHSIYSVSPSLLLFASIRGCVPAPPQHQQLPTSFVLHSTQSKPFSVLHQGSTSQLLCLQWMLTPYCCWGTYSTKAGGSIRSWRSRGARVTGGARLTISSAGTRASLEEIIDIKMNKIFSWIFWEGQNVRS